MEQQLFNFTFKGILPEHCIYDHEKASLIKVKIGGNLQRKMVSRFIQVFLSTNNDRDESILVMLYMFLLVFRLLLLFLTLVARVV